MKKNIHPVLRTVNVTDADGNSRQLLSAFKNATITVNGSRSMHGAWTKVQTVVKNNQKAEKLNKFFF